MRGASLCARFGVIFSVATLSRARYVRPYFYFLHQFTGNIVALSHGLARAEKHTPQK